MHPMEHITCTMVHIFIYAIMMFANVQKFAKTLWIIEVSNPSGVTEQQKINMTVAVHLGKTKKWIMFLKIFLQICGSCIRHGLS